MGGTVGHWRLLPVIGFCQVLVPWRWRLCVCMLFEFPVQIDLKFVHKPLTFFTDSFQFWFVGMMLPLQTPLDCWRKVRIIQWIIHESFQEKHCLKKVIFFCGLFSVSTCIHPRTKVDTHWWIFYLAFVSCHGGFTLPDNPWVKFRRFTGSWDVLGGLTKDLQTLLWFASWCILTLW